MVCHLNFVKPAVGPHVQLEADHAEDIGHLVEVEDLSDRFLSFDARDLDLFELYIDEVLDRFQQMYLVTGTKVMALPSLPARPVRPIRCT